MAEQLCNVPDCSRPRSSRGWCNLHYQRWRKGTFPGPLPDLSASRPKRSRRPSVAERLWGNVEKDGNGCWNWLGQLTHNGYGTMSANGRQVRTHRLAYQLARGEISEGFLVRHRCDNRRCINPDHLEVGTPADNSRDMVERGRHRTYLGSRTHCPKGHRFDEANTYWYNEARQCRTCKNEHLIRKRSRTRPDRIRKVVGDERDSLRSRAAELYRDGATLKEIAGDFGRSIGLVRDLLAEAGVSSRPRWYRRSDHSPAGAPEGAGE